jgi:hypothetical protein
VLICPSASIDSNPCIVSLSSRNHRLMLFFCACREPFFVLTRSTRSEVSLLQWPYFFSFDLCASWLVLFSLVGVKRVAFFLVPVAIYFHRWSKQSCFFIWYCIYWL